MACNEMLASRHHLKPNKHYIIEGIAVLATLELCPEDSDCLCSQSPATAPSQTQQTTATSPPPFSAGIPVSALSSWKMSSLLLSA